MQLTQLAAALGAEIVQMDGSDQDASVEISGVASPPLADAGSLVFAESAATFERANASGATAIVTSRPVFEELTGGCQKPVLLAPQPRLAFAQAAKLLRPARAVAGIDAASRVASTAKLGEGVWVGPGAVIGANAVIGSHTLVGVHVVIGAGVHIGAECHLFPRVVLYPGTQLGDRVIVHAGAVLGSDGFGYVRDNTTGECIQFPQQGRLVIEDDVEIGANTTIDRGALEETRIGKGSKIDNLVHVGHNVSVGRNVVIAAQTGVSGSSTLGDGAIVGGQVGIADHVEIGPGVILGAQAGIPTGKRIHGPGIVFWGTPARPIKAYLKELAMLARLTKRSK